MKVQYPGVAETFQGDLANAELIYALLSRFALPGLDPKALVDELRARMVDELDYRIEAANQAAFAEHYADHPFMPSPPWCPSCPPPACSPASWVDGAGLGRLPRPRRRRPPRQRAGEMLFRFAQGSIHRFGCFNGDPHPGNYRFHPDGRSRSSTSGS